VKRERGSSINRVLDILDTVASSNKPISATEINESLNLPKATAHRLCALLEAQGYLLKKLNGKSYMPGNRMYDMAVGVLTHSRFRALRHAILQSLSEEIGETCNIAYPDGLQMTYSDRVETQWVLRLEVPIGSSVPLHCTASGKLYLSTLSPAKLVSIVNKLDLRVMTKKTITDKDELIREIDSIRTNHLSIDNEELFDGIIAIAVPITDSQGRFYCSLAFQAPVFRLSLADGRQYIPHLRKAAQELSSLADE